MLQKNDQALQFLMTRRSRPAKTLKAPYPTRADLTPLITAALRTPDHGKLEPWRLVVLEAPALARLAEAARRYGADAGLEDEQIAKGAGQFSMSGLAVVVVSSPVSSPKIPEIEQVYSAGAVCLALLNASLAAGWGANWLSGWPSHHQEFTRQELGLSENEAVAGIIHIGTEAAPPPDRPRPDLSAKVTWLTS